MTAIATRTNPSSTPTSRQPTSRQPASDQPASPKLWKAGVVAGICAAAAVTAVAAAARAAGAPLETAHGQTIPLAGFAQLTLFFTAVGVLIARTVRRRAGQPRSTFTKLTVGLTCLSVVPDLVISAGANTKATFIATHLVAAAIVIPALSRRLAQ